MEAQRTGSTVISFLTKTKKRTIEVFPFLRGRSICAERGLYYVIIFVISKLQRPNEKRRHLQILKCSSVNQNRRDLTATAAFHDNYYFLPVKKQRHEIMVVMENSNVSKNVCEVGLLNFK